METTADKLQKILNTKEAIKQAIRDKGVYIGDYDAFAEYPHFIGLIETGSGEGESDEFFNLRTQNGTNMSNLFYNYSGSELDLSDWDTSQATDMSMMFAYCSGLISLDVSNFNTSNVVSMYQMFGWGNALTEINMSGWNTSNVSNMGYMFSGCNSLTSLDLSDWDTRNVTDISNMFSGCNALQTLRLDSFNTGRITSMNSMFNSCYGLTELDLSRFDTSNVNDMYSMFAYCNNLEKLNISNFDINTAIYVNTDEMFTGCDSLQELRLDNCNYDTINKIINSTNFPTGTINEETRKMYVQEVNAAGLAAPDGWEFIYVEPAPGLELTPYIDGQFESSQITKARTLVTAEHTDLSDMFENCSNLTAIYGIEQWDTSNVETMYDIFANCSSLTELDLSNFNTGNVTNMGSMFYQCSSLSSVGDLSSWDTSNVTTMSYMFSNCNNLTSLDLSSFDTSNVTTMGSMFDGCSGLTELDLSNFDTGKLSTIMGNLGMFSHCNELHTLRLDNCSNATISKLIGSATYLPTGLINGETRKMYVQEANVANLIAPNGWEFIYVDDPNSGGEPEEPEIYVPYEFQNNTDITEVTTMVNNTHTDLSSMFTNCINLATINGIENWDTNNVTDMSFMFNYCHKLITLDLSSFDTSNVTNMSFTFNQCSNLEILDIRNFDMSNVTDTSSMFNCCYELRELRLDNCSNDTVSKIINVLPKGTVDGETRKIYVNPDNIVGLKVPNDWIFVDCNTGEEIVNILYIPYEFRYNSNITEVTTIVNNTHTDLSMMFNGCFNLTAIYGIEQWDTSNVTTMNNMFNYCTSLTSLDLSSFNTYNVTTMHWMFGSCSSLEYLDIRNFDMTNVTDTDGMFYDCYELRELRLDNCDYNTINKIITSDGFPTGVILDVTRKIYVNPDNIDNLEAPKGWVFVDSDGNEIVPKKPGLTVYQEGEYRNNSDITEVYTLVTKEHTALSHMFENCENLQTINGIEQWDTSNVTDMYNMFRNCCRLTHLDLRSFDMSNVSDTMNMFRDCGNLQVLRLDNWDYKIIGLIINEAALPTGDIDGISRLMYVQEANIINPDNQVERLTAPVGWKFVYVAGNPQDTYDSDSKPFREDGDIQEVNVAVTKEHNDLSEMFSDCENLEVIHNIDTWDTGNVTDMSKMFFNCRKLIYLDLSGFVADNVNNMRDMFRGCEKLIYLDIRNFNILDYTEIIDMFRDCNNLQVLRLDNWADDKIERIINDTDLPTGDIDGRLRKMYLPEKYATNPEGSGLTVPDGWEFVYELGDKKEE